MVSGAQIETEAYHDAALIDQILLWKDKNFVANRAFQKFSMVLRQNTIPCPSFYQIKKRIEDLDSAIKLSKTPGQYFGKQQSFHDSFSIHLKSLLSMGKFHDENALTIKLSADG